VSEVRGFDELIVLVDNLLTAIGDPAELVAWADVVGDARLAARLRDVAARTADFGAVVQVSDT
jgi:hypothetical protein